MSESELPPAPLREPDPGARVPLTWGQEQMWLACQVSPDEPLYNEAFTIRRTGACDLDALRGALNLVLARNDAWRTSFGVADGVPFQRVHPHSDLALPLDDLTHLPEADREASAIELASADARKLFDLERGPMLRARLLRISESDHRVALVVHDLVFDDVSLRLFLAELVQAYADLAAGRSPALPDPAPPYSHYACWERETVTPEHLEPHLAYWREELAGITPVELPADRPAPAQRTAAGATERVAIDGTTTDALKQLAGANGTTLFEVFLAAYAVLLHRYTGQQDIVLAGLADGRRHPALEAMHGFFMNPIPVRVDCSTDPTFEALLADVRDGLRAGRDHEVPLGHLLGALHPDRGTTRNPILQVTLRVEPPLPPVGDGWELRELDVDLGAAKFDLSLVQDDRSDGSVGRFAYSSDLFDPETVRGVAEHWERLLRSIAAGANARISELAIVGDEQRHMLVEDWNRSDAPYPRDRCIHELVEEQVARQPDAVAITSGATSITYEALDEMAGNIAARLSALGVGPETRVGICIERSPHMVAGVLGILKSGGAYVPLDPSYPADRIAFMMEDAGIEILLTQRDSAIASSAGAATVVLVDDAIAASGPPRSVGAPGPAPVDSGNLAYVIFTSGSTGLPKGVCIEHRSVVNHITALIRDYGLGPADSVLQLPSLSFHPAVRDILGTLSAGARLVMLSEDSARDPLAIVDAMSAERVTALLSLMPSLLHAVLEDTRGRQVPVALRVVLTCGEALSLDDARKATARFGCLVANQFGPTESVMACAKHTVSADDAGIMTPAGRREANARLYVVDRYGALAPVGARGELYVGGESLARGYLNRPELTAERFGPDPFSTAPGARMYRTGDIVRYRRDGVLEFLGRQDDQTKIRGYRIELGEIEAVIMMLPEVRAAAATTSGNAGGERRLLAAVILEPGAEIAAIRAHLRDRLPAYMIPAAIVPVDAFPLTSSGKVNRPALAEQLGDYEEPSNADDPPATDTERALAAIWAKALGRSRIGRGQSFFDLGGHSLMAAQTLVAVEEQLGRRLPLSAFFRADPTVAALAAMIDDDNTPGVIPSANGPQELVMELRGGTAPGLFCLHPDESALISFRRWLPWLDTTRAVYGVLPPRVGRKFDRSSSVEQLSEALVEPILAVQPEGPFYIEGYSFGGLLAYEVAGRLRARGHEVAFLAIVDTPMPEDEWAEQRTMWAKARFELRRGPRSAVRKARGVALRAGRSALARLGLVGPENGWFDSDGSTALSLRYRPRPHDAPMVIFSATDTSEQYGSAALGWDKLHDGHVEPVSLSGNHFSILYGPSVETLARTFSDRVNAAAAARNE